MVEVVVVALVGSSCSSSGNSSPSSSNPVTTTTGKRLPICRNEYKQMRRNCYQQGRMEDHSIQCRVRQGTAMT